jgi:hypothetical protein
MAGLVARAAPSWNRQLGMASHVALVVTVNDGTGAPVTGLQASNFHVFDAGGHAASKTAGRFHPSKLSASIPRAARRAPIRWGSAAVGSETRSSSSRRRGVRTAVER